jgi:hypothetical protein
MPRATELKGELPMNEPKPEDVMRVLDLFHRRILETELAEKIYEQEIMAIIHAKYLILKYQAEAREKDAEIERLRAIVEKIKNFYNNLPGKTVGGSVAFHIEQITKEMR